jgi:nitrate reductase beta subunit
VAARQSAAKRRSERCFRASAPGSPQNVNECVGVAGKRVARQVPKIGGKWRVLTKIIATRTCLPEIDDYYEPFTFAYEPLQTAPELQAFADRAPALSVGMGSDPQGLTPYALR